MKTLLTHWTKLILALALIVLCTAEGCEDADPAKVAAKNQQWLLSPEVIGHLADGRRVARFKVVNPDNSNYPHYIYLIESNSTTTINTMMHVGKSMVPQVEVIIDGKTYRTVQVENE